MSSDQFEDEYLEPPAPPFGGSAPSPEPATAPGKQPAPALDALAAEVRALAASQPALAGEIVVLQAAIAALPHALGSVAHDAAQQQGSRNAEQMAQIKNDIGQILAAIAAQQPLQVQRKRPGGRTGWLTLLLWAGTCSSAALSGVMLAIVLGLGSPISGEAGRMATYTWMTNGQTIKSCLAQMDATGRGVQCPIVFMPQK